MSTTYTFASSLNLPGEALSGSKAIVADGCVRGDVALTASGTPVNVDLALIIAQMKGAFIVSTVDATLKVNDDGSPDATINLVAGVPSEWRGTGTNPMGSVDVASCTITNVSNPLAAGTVKFAFPYDFTP